MSSSLNSVILIGYAGNDAEYTPLGESMLTKFRLSTKRSKKVNNNWEDVTDWHNISYWNPTEALKPFLVKGTKFAVEGSLTYETWTTASGEKAYKTVIVANRLHILETAKAPNGEAPVKKQGKYEPKQAAQATQAQSYPTMNGFEDDEEVSF